MNPEAIITGAISLVAGLMIKIIFDWLKYGRNGRKKNNPNGVLKDMLSELKEIKEVCHWSKDIHNNMDPNTGQPRWYVTGIANDIRGVKEGLSENLKLMRKNQEMLLRVWARLTGGTDPGFSGD